MFISNIPTKISLGAIICIFLFLTACDFEPYYPPVESCFTTEFQSYKIGEEIIFKNCSNGAEEFFWDFGDGYQSQVFEPYHYYTRPGTYAVTLTAYGHDDDVHTSQMDIVVLSQPTVLSIRVMYNGTADPVSNCAVAIYNSKVAYESQTNPVATGFTNNNGDVEFVGMLPIVYYIDAYKPAANNKGFYTNWNLGYATNILEEYGVNTYDIFVEYGESKKKK